MKQLNDLASLKGKRQNISITELRSAPGEVLAQVELGMTFVVERAGKPVALISQYEPDALQLATSARRSGIVK